MDAGALEIVIGWDGSRCSPLALRSTRPQAADLLRGQSAATAVAMVPRLFSLCGVAQGVAARLAFAAARGCADGVAAVDLRAVALEAVGEHLWRLCLDWPPLLGGVQRPDLFRGWRRRLSAVAASDGRALAELAADLRRLAPSLLPPVLPGQRAAGAVSLLPWLDAAAWAALPLDEALSLPPCWQGRPAETGALARRAGEAGVAALLAAGRSVAARIAARVVELSALADGLADPALLAGWCDAASPQSGVGLARVETARGLLLHLMQVKDGRVARYVIVAPTEWNFHPRGAFVGEFAGIDASSCEEAAALAHRLALSLDPCVNFGIRVEEVADA